MAAATHQHPLCITNILFSDDEHQFVQKVHPACANVRCCIVCNYLTWWQATNACREPIPQWRLDLEPGSNQEKEG